MSEVRIGGPLNLQFLGDAFDHWKGSLFQSLHEAQIIQQFAVDPMASDLDSWEVEDFKFFAKLLRIKPDQIIPHRVSLVARETYFGEISHRGDLFFDPDTGVATGPVKEARRYIRPSEIGQFLDQSTGRLLIIYQHIRAQPVAQRVDKVMEVLRNEVGNFNWCSYESGVVAMLFLACRAERISRVADHFAAIMGRHALGRIRRSGVLP